MIKYYTTYVNDSKIINYKTPQKRKNGKKSCVVRGVYDIETNNEEGRFIVGGLALNNGNESGDTREDYNITFVNKPYLILQEIWMIMITNHYIHPLQERTILLQTRLKLRFL